MRTRIGTRGLAVVAAVAMALSLIGPAVAGPDDGTNGGTVDSSVPTAADVAAAEAAVGHKASDVETVQARLAVAEQQVEQKQIAAAQAVEAFNAARYRAQQAGKAARAAQRAADVAAADLDRQGEAYADAVNTSYRLGPSLSPLAAVANADGVSGVLENSTLLEHASEAIEGKYQTFDAAEVLARAADARADETLAEADAAQAETKVTRDRAEAAAADAADQAAAYAGERDGLIAELADLQDISVGLARERQDALEQAAAEAAALAAQEAAEQAAAEAAAEQAAQDAADQAAQDAADAAAQDAADQQDPVEPTPTPDPTEDPTTEPTPTPPTSSPDPTPPATSGGASAAISFARSQIGEPYRYGAAGPGSWDCSGLTMMAWKQGGKSLPHYSVGQYSATTPIKIGDLRPGDLLFWGSKPSSIYHVALYVGDGQMIHAPRTGRDVEQVSMYYWITPSYFARP